MVRKTKKSKAKTSNAENKDLKCDVKKEQKAKRKQKGTPSKRTQGGAPTQAASSEDDASFTPPFVPGLPHDLFFSCRIAASLRVKCMDSEVGQKICRVVWG